MRKIALFALFIFINCLLESCVQNIDNCYKIEISSLRNIKLDNFLEILPSDTTAANDYFIGLDAESINSTCMIKSSFGGGLLAEEPVNILTDKVSNISIVSNSDLSAGFPAGSELKSLFTPVRVQPNCSDPVNNNADCILDFFSELNFNSLEEAFNGAMSEQILFDTGNGINSFSLKIEEEIISNRHEFTVKFDFESGVLTELKTEEVFLN